MCRNKIPEEFNAKDIHCDSFLHFEKTEFLVREIARTLLSS